MAWSLYHVPALSPSSSGWEASIVQKLEKVKLTSLLLFLMHPFLQSLSPEAGNCPECPLPKLPTAAGSPLWNFAHILAPLGQLLYLPTLIYSPASERQRKAKAQIHFMTFIFWAFFLLFCLLCTLTHFSSTEKRCRTLRFPLLNFLGLLPWQGTTLG